MSISSLEKTNSYKSQSGIFSFGAPDSLNFSPLSAERDSIRVKDSKLGYVLEIIQKYEQKQSTYEQQSSNTTSASLHVLTNQPITRCKQPNSPFLSYLSTSHHLNSSYNDQIDNKSILDQQQSLSQFKLELQETHRNILQKYITPIRLIDGEKNYREQLLQSNERNREVVSVFVREDQEDIVHSQLVDRDSVPLVESVIMPAFQITYRKYANQQNNQVQQRIDEVEQKEKINYTNVEHDSSTVEENLTISQLMVFCLIVLALLMWKI